MKPRPTKKTERKLKPAPTARPRVVGLDISLSNTGVATLSGDEIISAVTFQTAASEPHLPRCLRIANYLTSSRIALTYAPEDAVFVREDYAYGASGVADVLLKELGGIIKSKFYELGHQLHAIPITSWKKFITGKGNADKDLVKKVLTKMKGAAAVKDWTEHDFDAVGVALTAHALINRNSLNGLRDYQTEVIDNLVSSVNSLVLLTE